jgi:hypothetical protein
MIKTLYQMIAGRARIADGRLWARRASRWSRLASSNPCGDGSCRFGGITDEIDVFDPRDGCEKTSLRVTPHHPRSPNRKTSSDVPELRCAFSLPPTCVRAFEGVVVRRLERRLQTGSTAFAGTSAALSVN